MNTGRRMERVGMFLLMMAAVLFMVGCASEESGFDEFDEFESEFETPDKEESSDPLGGYNRAMTTFNDAFYTKVLFPVARGYRYIVPEGGRIAIDNFFDNLLFPVRFVNNLLQFKIVNTLVFDQYDHRASRVFRSGGELVRAGRA